VGQTSTEGYDYLESKAEVDDEFVGLVLDHENQKLLTDARVAAWLESIQAAFGLPNEGALTPPSAPPASLHLQ
jgi:flavodoxin I